MHSEELLTHCQWHTCLAGVLPHMQSKTEVCEDDGPRSGGYLTLCEEVNTEYRREGTPRDRLVIGDFGSNHRCCTQCTHFGVYCRARRSCVTLCIATRNSVSGR
jgi:hypothetical protein